MGLARHQQESAFRSFGNKLANAAGHLKTVYDIGSTIYHAAKVIAPVAMPIIRALLYILSIIIIYNGGL